MNTIHSLEELYLSEYVISAEELSPEGYEGRLRLFSLRYESSGCQVVGYLAAPADYLEKSYYTLVYNRGGNQEYGALTTEDICKYAALGYIAIGSQYRGNGGGTGREQFGGNDVKDVIRLIDIAEHFSFAASPRVFMVGHSRGGMMTYIACRRTPERIIAAVVRSGIADCFDMYISRDQEIKDLMKDLIGGTPEEVPAEYERRSAVRWAGEIQVPILILHGTKDWRVQPRQAEAVAKLLEEHHREHKLIIYPGATHSLEGTTALLETKRWLDSHQSKALGQEKL